MLESYVKMDKTPDQERRLQDAQTKSDKFLKAFMNHISDNNAELMILAYELRLQDKDDDKFTNIVLGFIDEEKLIPLFREIILDNKKNQDGELSCSGTLNYRLKCGNDFNLIVKYKDDM